MVMTSSGLEIILATLTMAKSKTSMKTDKIERDLNKILNVNNTKQNER